MSSSRRRCAAPARASRWRRREPARELRTFAAIEFAWAVNARARRGRPSPRLARGRSSIRPRRPRCSAPVPGAIRFDAPAAGNRPGAMASGSGRSRRAGSAARRCSCRGAREGWPRRPSPRADAVVVPMPVATSGAGGERDIAAITYAANPEKKGLDRVLAAWLAAARPGEELVVAGLDERAGAAWLAARRRGGGGRAASRRDRPAWPARGGGAPATAAKRALRRDALARGVPGAAAALARLRDGAAARGLRHRAARGPRGRVHARHDAAPGPTPRCRSRARSTRGSSRSDLAARSGPRSTTRSRYAERAAAALRRGAESVDRVVAESCCRACYLTR